MTLRKVHILMGGISAEREISLKTGRAILRNLSPDRYLARSVEIQADGSWKVSGSNGDSARTGSPAVLLEDPPDVVLIGLHGPYGEDGCIQGLLETFRFPYTGSGVLASAAAMDKPTSKALFQKAGLATTPWLTLSRSRWPTPGKSQLEAFVSEHEFPLIVKPADSGSSFGVALVKTPDRLVPAVREAFRYSERTLVERYVKGRELQCGILANADEEEALVLPVTEIIPDGEIFDYRNKYTPGVAREITPAQLSDLEAASIRRAVIGAHRALGCDGLSRVDTILTADGTVYVLEVNTIPGMTETSLCPQQAEAAGIGFSGLLDRMIELAFRRSRNRLSENVEVR